MAPVISMPFFFPVAYLLSVGFNKFIAGCSISLSDSQETESIASIEKKKGFRIKKN